MKPHPSPVSEPPHPSPVSDLKRKDEQLVKQLKLQGELATGGITIVVAAAGVVGNVTADPVAAATRVRGIGGKPKCC